MSNQIVTVDSEQEWNGFLKEAAPHSFLHSWEWGEFNQKMGSDIFRLAVIDDQKIDAIALLIYVKARRGSFLLCPHGPIYRENTDKPTSLALITTEAKKIALILGCQFIRICPLMINSSKPKNIYQPQF